MAGTVKAVALSLIRASYTICACRKNPPKVRSGRGNRVAGALLSRADGSTLLIRPLHPLFTLPTAHPGRLHPGGNRRQRQLHHRLLQPPRLIPLPLGVLPRQR